MSEVKPKHSVEYFDNNDDNPENDFWVHVWNDDSREPGEDSDHGAVAVDRDGKVFYAENTDGEDVTERERRRDDKIDRDEKRDK